MPGVVVGGNWLQRAVIVLVATAIASLAALAPLADARQVPAPDTEPPDLPSPPPVDAAAWLVFDATDNTVLAGENMDERRAIASITKLMTALVVVEHTTPEERITVSAAAANTGEASLSLRAGQQYTADTLLAAILIYSANDAAVALAEHVGGSVDGFLTLMNDKAAELELTDTNFTTPNGLDTTGNHSTALDIVTLAQAAMGNARIAGFVKMERYSFPQPGGSPTVIENRNLLLGEYPGVDGVKTGQTNLAGWSLVGHYADRQGADIYTVILGEPTDDGRFLDTRELLDWVRTLRPVVVIAAGGERVGETPLAFSDRRVGLHIADEVRVRIRIGERFSERIVVPSIIEPPVAAGDTVGRYEVLVDGEVVATSDVFVEERIPQVSRRDELEFYVENADVAAREGVSTLRREVGDFREFWGI